MKKEKKFIVVQSSAGSGKTYTLVRHYLLILLQSPDVRYYRSVLAITFTNKATNEMKERVIDALTGISEGEEKYHPLARELAQLSEMSEKDVRVKTKIVLQNLIHDYAEFSISTIDRFVYRIIRSFSFELNIPGSAEIELDRKAILEAGVDALLDRLTEDDDLTDMLLEFAEHKFEDNKSIKVKNDLVSMASEVMNAKTEPFLHELEKLRAESFKKVKSAMLRRRNDIRLKLVESAEKLLKLLDDLGIENHEIAGGERGLPNYLRQYFSMDDFEMKEPFSSVLKIAETGKWHSSKVKGNRLNVFEANRAELSSLLENFLSDFNQLRPSYIFCDVMLSRIHAMALVNEIHIEITQYKKEEELVQLDDFNTMIGKLVDDSPVPYIYERIGEKYNHYLIDEFQDTSQIQWYNLLPLIENSLSTGNRNLVVGDSKQAIYRFRGGDVEQMTRLPKLEFSEKADADLSDLSYNLEQNIEKINLEHNYRSTGTIVNFVNDFFSAIKEKYPEESRAIYHDHEQGVIKEGQGSVEVRFLAEDESERFARMDESVKAFLEAGYSYGDISVLCRTKDQCSNLANFLIEKGHAVISTESLKLGSSHEVQFLIQWLRYRNESGGDVFAFPILEYLVSEGTLGEMSRDDMLSLWLAENSLEKVLGRSHPDFKLSFLPEASLLEFFTILIRAFLKGKGTDPFVVNFIEQVSKFQGQWGNDMGRFLEWWDDVGARTDIEMPESEDSIHIMTIHKAKGLEFEIVIVPHMQGKIKSGADHFWTETRGEDREFLEVTWLPSDEKLMHTHYAPLYQEEMKRSFIDALNLMYVAMTRAITHLVIYSKDVKGKEDLYKEESILRNCLQLEHSGEEEGVFRRGKLNPVSKKEDKAQNMLVYEEKDGADWKKRVQLKYRIDKNVLDEEDVSAQAYGNLIHDMLSEVHVLSDLKDVLRNYINQGLLTIEGAQKIQKDVLETIENSDILEYFNDNSIEVQNERDLLSKDGLVVRPDRMILLEDEVIIVDYKSGMPDESHEAQVLNYKNILNDIGYKKVRAFLAYFSLHEVRRVA